MAANSARRTLLSSSTSAKSFLSGCPKLSSPLPSLPSGASKLRGFASTKPTSAALFSRHQLRFFSRLPVELGCVQSLMPFHTASASALLTSMLSLEAGNWGWLSEGNRRGNFAVFWKVLPSWRSSPCLKLRCGRPCFSRFMRSWVENFIMLILKMNSEAFSKVKFRPISLSCKNSSAQNAK